MPSQYGEDALILDYFSGRTGRFLDIGAGDGLTFSNTKPLLDAGWSGVMVEPSISQLRWLIENHGENPNVDIVCAGVTDLHSRVEEFWDARDYSTFVPSHRALMAAHSQGTVCYKRRIAPVLSWNHLLSGHPGPYEFINIDVEGMNLELVRSCVLWSIGVEMVCVEIDPESALPEMMRILSDEGLIHQEKIGGNLLAWI